MEEIDLKELFEFLKGKIEVIIITVIFICTVGCLYILFIQKPLYSSYTTVILSSKDANETIDTTSVTLNNNLVETYANVVKSRSVLEQVIQNLKLDMSYESLSSSVSVSAINKTQIIKISVSDLEPETARKIANETATEFTKVVEKIFRMDNIGVLDEATTPTSPYNINIPKTLIICFFIGVVLSLAILFIIFYFDRTIKSTEQIEQKIKLPILGSVQDFNKGGKK